MKRLLIVSVAALFLTTGCRSISPGGLPEQYEPAFADDADTTEPILGSLKSRVKSTADQINSSIEDVAKTATEMQSKAVDTIGQQFDPLDDE